MYVYIIIYVVRRGEGWDAVCFLVLFFILLGGGEIKNVKSAGDDDGW